MCCSSVRRAAFSQFIFGFCAEIVACRHTESIAQQVRNAENNYDARGQAGAGNAGDDCKCRDRSINRAVYEVTQVAVLRRSH